MPDRASEAVSETVKPSNRSCTSRRRVREAGVHLRDAHLARSVTESRLHLDHGVGLAVEVELGSQPVGELREQLARPDVVAQRRATLRDVGEQRQRCEITLHDDVDAGSLDLHHDGLAGEQPAVRLADRRGGERLPVELGEPLLDGVAELALEDRSHLVDRDGAGAVLERGERFAHLRWKQVDPRRGDLTELDVDTSRVLEQAPEPDPDRLRVERSAAPRRDERPEALAPCEPDQLAVPTDDCDPPAQRLEWAAARPRAPPRSPIVSEPGRARRSSATAAPIVAGIPTATMCTTRSSAPQSHPARFNARNAATPQPRTPASSAALQPRRMPRSRSEIAVERTAITRATTTRVTTSPAEVATTTSNVMDGGTRGSGGGKRRRRVAPRLVAAPEHVGREPERDRQHVGERPEEQHRAHDLRVVARRRRRARR